MRRRRGEWVAFAVAVATALVLTLGVAVFQDEIWEEWCLYRFEHGEPEEQVKAIRELGKLRSVRAVPQMLEFPVAEYEKNGIEVEETLYAALMRVRPPAVPFLVERLREDPLAWRDLVSPNYLSVVTSLELPASRDRAVTLLLDWLEEEEDDARAWASYVTMWVHAHRSPVFPGFADVTDRDEFQVTLCVCQSIVDLAPQAGRRLEERARRQAGEERAISLRLLLGASARSRSVGFVFGRLLADQDPTLRESAADLLWYPELYLEMAGDAEDRRITAALRRALEDSSRRVRERAAVAAARFVDVRDEPEVYRRALEEASQADEAYVRQRAAAFLTALYVMELQVPPHDPRVRALAGTVLDGLRPLEFELDGRRAETPKELRESTDRRFTAKAVELAGEAWRAEILARLGSDDPFTRAGAATALAVLGAAARSAVPVLLGATHDEHTFVRISVVEALGSIGADTPEVRAALTRLQAKPGAGPAGDTPTDEAREALSEAVREALRCISAEP